MGSLLTILSALIALVTSSVWRARWLTELDGSRRRPARECARLFVLSFVVFAGAGTVTRADDSNRSAIAMGQGPQFAVSDFDGDHQPDTAKIQGGAGGYGRTDYWIQLELSATGRQFIRLAAPAGGLQIEARDVNGDHAIDLVLSTAWSRRPVAILLNDGHGRFSRAEPSTYPGAFSESRTRLTSESNQSVEFVELPSQSQDGFCEGASCVLRDRSPAARIQHTISGFVVTPFLAWHAGRAPPSEVPLT
jgi:hypothetical protein